MGSHEKTVGITTGLINLAAAGASVVVKVSGQYVISQLITPANGTIFIGGASATTNMIPLPATGLEVKGPAELFVIGAGASAAAYFTKQLNSVGITLGY